MSDKLIIFFLFFTLLSSCGVDEFDTSDIDIEIIEADTVIVNDIMTKARSNTSASGVQIECVTVLFPLRVIDDKNIIHFINSENEFHSLFTDSTFVIVDFVYPLEFADILGFNVVANNLWDFASYVAGCYPEDFTPAGNEYPAFVINGENSCFCLDYPLTVKTLQNKILNIPDEKTFIQKQVAEPLFFVFPLTLKDEFGNKTLVTDGEFLLFLLSTCNDIINPDSSFGSYSYFGCYKFDFPIQIGVSGVNLPVTVANSHDLGNILMQGRFNGFIFPFRLLDPFGQITSIESDEDILNLLLACGQKGDLWMLLFGTSTFEIPACYDIVFPVRATDNFGNNKNFTNLGQLTTAIQDSTFSGYFPEYPINIKRNANNETVSLLSIDDIYSELENCD